jgi:[acyl-carrier-protein] S-malonyltransferase
MSTNAPALASQVVVFPGQVFEASIVAGPLRHFAGEPLVDALAELVGTDAWETLDCTDPAVAGPCTLVGGLLTARQLVDRKRVVATAGHSFGEITALAYAGGLADHDAMRVVARRGELSRGCAAARDGCMAAIMGVTDTEIEWARRITVAETGGVIEMAAVNDERQFVLTGDRLAIETAQRHLAGVGAAVAPLPIPGAYHSPIMQPAVEDMAAFLAATDVSGLDLPVYSYIDGRAHHEPADFRQLIPRGLVMPVRWRRLIETLAADGAVEALDPGPGQVLSRLGRRSRVLRFRSLALEPTGPIESTGPTGPTTSTEKAVAGR